MSCLCFCLCLCLWPRWCSGRRLILLWGRAAWCARGRRPAREPSAPRASLGASSRSSPVPSGPSGALHAGGACGSGLSGQDPPPMGAQMGSGERNIAPAWCSSSWHGASLKQKPPTHAHNRRKSAYLGVLGRIIFHGAPQQLTYGRFFFHSGPACGHRCQQLSADRGCRGRRLLVDLSCR